jgi:predicted TIM-barrel fold metal-dependent hydrolase
VPVDGYANGSYSFPPRSLQRRAPQKPCHNYPPWAARRVSARRECPRLKPHGKDRRLKPLARHISARPIEISTLANPHYAAALARACNSWMVERWLPRDARFKGSLVVAPQDPVRAAQEIRRIGSHPDIVQVLD